MRAARDAVFERRLADLSYTIGDFMYKVFAIAGLASLTLAGPAFADEPTPESVISYNYLEADYVNADFDGLSGSNPDGLGLKGAIGFTPMLHGYLDYDRVTASGTTIQALELGVGLNYSLTSNVDLIGRLGYARGKVEGFGSDDGLGLQAGIRARPVANFEVDALVHYIDLDDAGDNTSLKLAGRYFFAPQFSFGAGVEIDDDLKLWNVGVRWTFK
jgi:hypothetical protein